MSPPFHDRCFGTVVGTIAHWHLETLSVLQIHFFANYPPFHALISTLVMQLPHPPKTVYRLIADMCHYNYYEYNNYSTHLYNNYSTHLYPWIPTAHQLNEYYYSTWPAEM